MKAVFQKIIKVLNSRLARNIYFITAWLMSSKIDFSGPRWKLFYASAVFSYVPIQLYVNNFLLVPRFLAKKKYLLYSISIVLFTCCMAFVYAVTMKSMIYFHPGAKEGDVSLFLTSRIDGNFAFAAIVQQMQSYFGILLIMTFIFTMAWYMIDYSRQQKMLEEAKQRQLETELLFLKGQINPHFLFNTLNNLYGLAIKKADQAPDAILKLSAILRYLLYESDTQKVSFEREKEIMLAFIDLELLRLTNKENFTFSITSDAQVSVPPLLWLPILENVFKHGTRFISDDYKIDYRFAIQNSRLSIYSKNNYRSGAQAGSLEKGGGIGLANLKQRLDILYPGKYTLTAGGENKEYITDLEILLN